MQIGTDVFELSYGGDNSVENNLTNLLKQDSLEPKQMMLEYPLKSYLRGEDSGTAYIPACDSRKTSIVEDNNFSTASSE